MNSEPTTQESLFNAIKNSLPANISLVHDVSELLGISYDSAYRRIRGEKELSLDELKKLSLYYKISIDTLFNIKSNNVVFNSLVLGDSGISFNEWLQNILLELKKINSFKEKEIIYSAKDIPIFHYFEFPEIFAFKVYFWHKALIPTHEFEDQFIRLEVSDQLMETGISAVATTILTWITSSRRYITMFTKISIAISTAKNVPKVARMSLIESTNLGDEPIAFSKSTQATSATPSRIKTVIKMARIRTATRIIR